MWETLAIHRSSLLRERHHHRFRLQIGIERLRAVFSTDSRALHSAERKRGICEQYAVDEDSTALKLRCCVMRSCEIAGPHVRGQTIDAVVGEFERFVQFVKSCRGQDRAEDFLARDFSIGFHVPEYSRSKKVPLLGQLARRTHC